MVLTHVPEFIVNAVIAVMLVAIGFFVLRKNYTDRANRLFALLTILNAMWIFTSAMVDLLQQDLNFALLYTELAIAPPLFFFPTFYVFTRAFISERGLLPTWKALLLYAPALGCLPLVFTRLNVVEVSLEEWGINFVPGPMYTVLLLYMVTTVGLGIRELIIKYRAAPDPSARAQIKFLLIGFFLFMFFAALANLVLPILGYGRAVVFGPASTIFFVIFTMYAIIKHHLLDVKVIAAELFASLLTLVAFLQVLTSNSVPEFGVRVLIFAATAVVSMLLIQSVIQEVRRREEIQQLATELEIKNKRLRQLDDLKTTMVSIASHQIRGPLGGMRGYLSMFRDGDFGPLTDKQREIVATNLNVLTRLLNAVETFLDITKLEAGKMTLRKEVLPLDDAVADVVKEFEVPLQKKGLALSFEVTAARPVWVEFDPEKIKHVVFNLIDNAMKYTEKGGIAVTVRTEGPNALLEVTDTGMGIPAQDVPRLFGKYERGELVVDRGGSGLGLYVVKMLTEMQGGQVGASSKGVGLGSTFRVTLPLSAHA